MIRPAAVSCSPDAYRLGGVKIWSGMTGKLGRAWHWCMGGAWRFGWAYISQITAVFYYHINVYFYRE